MIAQIQLVGITDPVAARMKILERRAEIEEVCNATDPILTNVSNLATLQRHRPPHGTAQPSLAYLASTPTPTPTPTRWAEPASTLFARTPCPLHVRACTPTPARPHPSPRPLPPPVLQLGGGFRDLEVRILETKGGPMVIAHLVCDTRDAMGANAVNSMAEQLGPKMAEWTQGEPHCHYAPYYERARRACGAPGDGPASAYPLRAPPPSPHARLTRASPETPPPPHVAGLLRPLLPGCSDTAPGSEHAAAVWS